MLLLLALTLVGCESGPRITSSEEAPLGPEDWLALAEQGDRQAQYKAGEMYFYGISVPRDRDQASHWYHLAAERNHPKAQHALGVMAYGQKDYQAAVKWFQLSADQGFADAYTSLSWMYAGGKGVLKDLDAAEKLRLDGERIRRQLGRK